MLNILYKMNMLQRKLHLYECQLKVNLRVLTAYLEGLNSVHTVQCTLVYVYCIYTCTGFTVYILLSLWRVAEDQG